MATELAPYVAPQQLSTRDTVDGWASMLTATAELARIITGGEGFVPKGMNAASVTACILAGRELGIGPMTSLQHLYVIEGRPSMSAQLMRGLVLARGHELDIREWDARHCTMAGRRAGSERWQGPVTFTWADAERARLDRRPVWQAYPMAMVLARVTGMFCRAVFPDVIGGMVLTAEEAADLAGETQPLPWLQPETPQQPAGATVQRTQVLPQAEALSAPSQPQSVAPSTEPPLDDDESPTVATESKSPAAREATRQAAIQRAKAERAQGNSPGAPPAELTGDEPASPEQQRHIHALLRELQRADTRDMRMRVVQGLLSRRVQSSQEMTLSDASAVIDTLVRARESEQPGEYLDWLVDQGMEALELMESGDTTQDADVVDGPWEQS